MKTRNFIVKYLLPVSLTARNTDQRTLSSFSKENPTLLEQRSLREVELNKKIRAKNEELNQMLETLREPQVIVAPRLQAVADSHYKAEAKRTEFVVGQQELAQPILSETEQAKLKRFVDLSLEEAIRAVRKNNQEITSFKHTTLFKGQAKKSLSNASSNKGNIIIITSASESTGEVVETTSNLKDTMLNTVETTSNTVNLPETSESNLFGYLSELKEGIESLLAALSTEQLGCISNLMGFVMIFGGMLSITTILFSQYFIDGFKLEERFPKLAKYLKLRQTIDKYYLIFNFVLIYLILIFYIALNLFMFYTA